jgi:solute carrier family 35 protein E1
MSTTEARDAGPHATFKFPAFEPDLLPTHEEEPFGLSSSRTASPSHAAHTNGYALPSASDRWQPRKEARVGFANHSNTGPSNRHGRQKSLSEAFQTIRTRKGSVSQNAHEIADALKAPLSPKLIVCCKELSQSPDDADERRRSAVSGT